MSWLEDVWPKVSPTCPWSGRQRKAWGGAQQNPRKPPMKSQPTEWATALNRRGCRPLRGLVDVGYLDLGFRCAPPQALRCRPLCGLVRSLLWRVLRRRTEVYDHTPQGFLATYRLKYGTGCDRKVCCRARTTHRKTETIRTRQKNSHRT